MSPISLSLDLLLMLLLMAALIFGWRLERRLKGLKESHVDFATAVAELNTAAARAECAEQTTIKYTPSSSACGRRSS